MDIFYKVIALLGGLSMFLYGMRLMGDGLKSSSGGAMKKALARVTAKPALGFLFGMLVTCMIQSSTATNLPAVCRYCSGRQRRYGHYSPDHPSDGPECRRRKFPVFFQGG